MLSLKHATSFTTAAVLASGLVFNQAAAEPADMPAPDAGNTLTVRASEIAQPLSNHCRIYTNVLTVFDSEHINGETSVPHSEMATAAIKGAAQSTIYLSGEERKPTEYNPGSEADDFIASMTFVDGTNHRFAPAPGSLSTYEDQCRFVETALQILSEKTDVPLDTLHEVGLNSVIEKTRDPHSSYIAPRDRSDFQEQTRGSFAGVGAEVGKQVGEYLQIKGFVEGGPAGQTELKEDDFVTHIDGQSTKEMTTGEAVDLIKGEPGTEVNFTVKRGDQEPFNVAITRAVIEPKVVTHKMIGDTLHVTVKTFNKQTYKQFFEAIAAGMAEWSGKNAMNLEKLVIDVRGNPGGLLDQVAAMIDRLIHQDDPEQQKQIMATGKSAADLEDRYFNDAMVPVNFPKFKITVLTDGGSASASEILAGALVDEGHDVVGTRSYGKGSVQTIIPIIGGQGGLARVTTSAFFPGTSVLSNQGAGIPPTVKVTYGDFRDEEAANRKHESDRAGSLLPAGQTREHVKPKFSCTLDSDFSGSISDENISNLAEEFTKGVVIRSIERRRGAEVTEEAWAEIMQNPEAQESFEAEKEGYKEYLQNFVHTIYRRTGDNNNPFEAITVMDADRLCAQHKLDGVQEIEYGGTPITTIEEIRYPTPTVAP